MALQAHFLPYFSLYLSVIPTLISAGTDKVTPTIGVFRIPAKPSRLALERHEVGLDHEFRPNKTEFGVEVKIVQPSSMHDDLHLLRDDTYNLTKYLCDKFIKVGRVHALLVDGNDHNSYLAAKGVAKAAGIPLVTWNFPLARYGTLAAKKQAIDPQVELSVKPPMHDLIADVIIGKNWTKAFFIYHDDRSLYLMQAVVAKLKNKTSTFFTMVPKKLNIADEKFFLHLHSNASRTYHRAILHIMDRYEEKMVLKRLMESALRTYSFHYLIATYHLYEELLDSFKSGLMNLTSFNFLENLQTVKRTLRQHGIDSFENIDDSVMLHDAVAVSAMAIEKVPNELLPARPSCPVGNKELAKSNQHPSMLSQSFFEQVENVRFEGLSGSVIINSVGVRTNVSADVLELTFKGKKIMQFDKELHYQWIENQGLPLNFSDPGLFSWIPKFDYNKIWQIVTQVNKPFVMEKQDEKAKLSNDTTEKYEGYVMDLIKKIAEVIPGFKYNVHIVKDGNFGSPSKTGDGEWDGMIGELLRGEAEMVVSSLTNTRVRERVVDFSKPFLDSGITIMVKKPEQNDFNAFSFMYPLSFGIWLALTGLYLLTSILLYVECRFSPVEKQESLLDKNKIINKFSFSNCLWINFAAFVHQGVDLSPRSGSAHAHTTPCCPSVIPQSYLLLSNYAPQERALPKALLIRPVQRDGTLGNGTGPCFGIYQGTELYGTEPQISSHAQESDLAIASLTITKARERVVDFSKPYMSLGISIMIKKPEKQNFSVFSFMSPLSNNIWYFVGLAYLAVSSVIFLVSRISHLEWRQGESATGETTFSNDFDIYNCLWFTLAAFMQQGTDIVPRSISGRIASSAWWFFTMIIVSSYTANLAAFLTLEKIKTPINTVKELANQNHIKYGIQNSGSTAEFFRDSSVDIYRKMWQYMDSHPEVFVKSYSEGIQKVRESKERYAFLLESTTNEFTNSRKPCDTMRVGDKLNSVGYGIATPFGSPLKDRINLAILELQEKGELKALQLKWWYDKGECEQGRSDSHSESLNLSKVAGIFYILIGGMVAAMVCASGEYMYRSRVESRRTTLPKMMDTTVSPYLAPSAYDPKIYGETSKGSSGAR